MGERLPHDRRRVANIELDELGVGKERFGLGIGDEIVERHRIAFADQLAAGFDDLRIDDDVFPQLDHDGVRRQERGGIVQQQLPGEIQKRRHPTRDRVEADPEKRIGQDAGGGKFARRRARAIGRVCAI